MLWQKEREKKLQQLFLVVGVTYGTLTCDTTKDKLGREIKVISTWGGHRENQDTTDML